MTSPQTIALITGANKGIGQEISRQLAQTPQGFPRRVLVDAHRRAQKEHIAATDDAALLERIGVPVRVVRGSERALKVTDAFDFARVDALFSTDE